MSDQVPTTDPEPVRVEVPQTTPPVEVVPETPVVVAPPAPHDWSEKIAEHEDRLGNHDRDMDGIDDRIQSAINDAIGDVRSVVDGLVDGLEDRIAEAVAAAQSTTVEVEAAPAPEPEPEPEPRREHPFYRQRRR